MTMDRREMTRAALAMLCAPLAALRSPAANSQDSAAYEATLVSVTGERTVLGLLPGSVFAPRVSPDGKRLAFELRDGGSPNGATRERIWIAELEHLDRRQPLPVVGKGRNWAPLWTPDGRRVVFLVSGEERDELHWQFADGTGHPEHLVDGLSAEAMSADGRKLAFITLSGDRDYGISLLYLPSKLAVTAIDRPGSEQHSSHMTRDGRWIAYASNETGRHEVWVESLPSSGQRVRITPEGGSHPVWSAEGDRLYFDRDGQIYIANIDLTGSTPRVQPPRPLPIRGFQQGYRRRQFDLMPDGRRFLMLFPRVTR